MLKKIIKLNNFNTYFHLMLIILMIIKIIILLIQEVHNKYQHFVYKKQLKINRNFFIKHLNKQHLII